MSANQPTQSRPSFWSLTRRVSTGRKYFPEIDGLRFIAIMSVVLYHLNDYMVVKSQAWTQKELSESLLYSVLHVGGIGVPLFFAISGFILALPMLIKRQNGQPLNIRRYLTRRLTRLEPPYLINLAIVTTLLILVKKESIADLVPHLLASIAYLHNLIYGEMSRINFVAWSLEIEVQFYLLMPLLAFALFRGNAKPRRLLLAAMFLLVVGGKWYFGHVSSPRIGTSLLLQFDHFLAGVLLADVFVNAWNNQPVRETRFDVAAFAMWSVLLVSQIHFQAKAFLAPLIFATYYTTLRGKFVCRLLSCAPVSIVGGMCYTIYLYHFYIISLIGRFILPKIQLESYEQSFLVFAVTCVPIVLLVSSALFKLFEQPFMNWTVSRPNTENLSPANHQSPTANH